MPLAEGGHRGARVRCRAIPLALVQARSEHGSEAKQMAQGMRPCSAGLAQGKSRLRATGCPAGTWGWPTEALQTPPRTGVDAAPPTQERDSHRSAVQETDDSGTCLLGKDITRCLQTLRNSCGK